MFFIAVSFWNLVGAGLFGFLINPPLSLYYMQGLNLTPLHGHTALFGVYGMLGIALMLFCLRGLRGQMVWNTKPLKVVVLVPQHRPGADGAADAAAAGHDAAAGGDRAWLLRIARSAEFMQQPIVELLVWMRVPGDTIFSVGALSLAWFVLRLWIAPQRDPALAGETESRLAARYQAARRGSHGCPVVFSRRLTWIKAIAMTSRHTAGMDTTSRAANDTLSPRLLANAPHRLMFAIGAANVLLAMAWWTAVAGRRTLAPVRPAAPQVYGGWLHAIVMQYQVLAPFMFGFLLTVFPRWMGLADLPRLSLPPGRRRPVRRPAADAARRARPGAVAACRCRADAGGLVDRPVLPAALGLAGPRQQPGTRCRAPRRCCSAWSASRCTQRSCTCRMRALMFAAIKFGSFGLLLPVYFTVAHRMFPFFAGNVVAGYRAVAADCGCWARSGRWCCCTSGWSWCTATPGCGWRTCRCSR